MSCASIIIVEQMIRGQWFRFLKYKTIDLNAFLTQCHKNMANNVHLYDWSTESKINLLKEINFDIWCDALSL